MASSRELSLFLGRLRCLLGTAEVNLLSDDELLRRFQSTADNEAFDELVRRHGPLVWGVCRRVLGCPHDTEDAFQAVFLVLVRKAPTLRNRESLAGWLYQVAYHIASRARATAARRRQKEGIAACMKTTPPAATDPEALAVLDEELSCLSRRERLLIVLCLLNGKTHAQAAQEVGCPVGSVSRHLRRACERLRQRLERRGIGLTAAALATILADQATAAAPIMLHAAVTRAGVLLATGQAATGLLSAQALHWGEQAVRAVAAVKLKASLMVLLGMAVLGAGGGLVASRAVHAWLAGPPAPADASPLGVPQRQPAPAPAVDRSGNPLPTGAVLRLGTVPLRQGDYSGYVRFSRDGRLLYSWSDDGIVHVWDPVTGRELRTFGTGDGGPKGPYSLALSADERVLGAGKLDGTAHLFDFGSGKEIRSIATKPRPRASMMSLALSCDGRLLASGSEDFHIHLWATATGEELLSLEGRLDPVYQMEFTRTGGILVGGTTAGGAPGGDSVIFWDVATGKPLRRLPVEGMRDPAFALAPDGRTIAVPQGTHLALYEVATGKRLRLFDKRPGAIGALAFNERGTLLATAHEDGIRLWEAATGKERCRIELKGQAGAPQNPPVECVALSPDGSRLAATVWGSPVIRLFDVATGRELFQQPGHRNRIHGVSFSPDGRILVTGEADAGDSRICFWDLTRPGQPRICRAHTRGMCGVRFAPDGKTAISGGWDDTVRIWDAATGRELRCLDVRPGAAKPHASVHALAVSPDGKTVTVLGSYPASRDASVFKSFVQRWEWATGTKLLERPTGTGFGNLSPDGRVWAPNGVRFSLLDVASGTLRAQGSEELRYVREIEIAPDGWAAAGVHSRDGRTDSIILWEAATGNELRRLTPEGTVNVLAFSPDSRMLAAGGLGNNPIQLWDLSTGKILQRLEGYRSAVTRLEFSPDGLRLATGLVDTTTLIWDVTPAARQLRPRPTHRGPAELKRYWDDLASEDAARGQEAAWALSAAPADAVPFLKERLRPVAPPDGELVARLVRELDSPRFSVREAASRQLERLSGMATAALRRALQGNVTPEARRRLEALLASPPLIRTAQIRRAVRAIQALGRMHTAQARALLGEMARGAAGARETEEAQAALARLR